MSPLRRHTPLKRSLIRHRPRRNRTLTREGWAALNARVFNLDVDAVMDYCQKQNLVPLMLIPGTRRMVAKGGVDICPAVVMDPSEWGNCWGEWRQDHVKDDPMTGQKAPDDEWHLVCLCAGHDERGMRAGHVWNIANRDKERIYLRERRPERP